MKALTLTLFVVVGIMVAVSVGLPAENVFKAVLSGDEDMPMAVPTKSTGDVKIMVNKDGAELTFVLTINKIENVTAAHIHAGKKGEEGPPIVGLFGGPKKDGMFSGILSRGTILDKDLSGPLAGKTVADLIKMIKNGEAYVNVHTIAHPGGEVRGQLK